MLFVNEKYRPLNVFLEEDEMNEGKLNSTQYANYKDSVIDSLFSSNGSLRFGDRGDITVPSSELLKGVKNSKTLKNTLLNASSYDEFSKALNNSIILSNLQKILNKNIKSVWTNIYVEPRVKYSSNQNIHNFIVSRDIPNIKDHLESAFKDDNFKNAQNPWFLIFNNPSSKLQQINCTASYGKYTKETTVDDIKELFGDGFDVTSGTNGNLQYFTVTDKVGKIVGSGEEDNGKGEKITFKFIKTGKMHTNSSFPSASDMEMIIAFSYNKFYGPSNLRNNDEENIGFVGINKSASKNFTDYFQNCNEFCKKLADHIYVEKHPVSLTKLPKAKGVSDAWIEAGEYVKGDKIDTTPKTDLISGDGKYKFSLKQSDTGAQAMSGGFRESKATMMCVLAKLFTSNDGFIINGVNLTSAVKSALSNAAGITKQRTSNIVKRSTKAIDTISDEVVDRVKNLFKEIKDTPNDDSLVTVTPGRTKRSKSLISLANGIWMGTTFNNSLETKIVDLDNMLDKLQLIPSALQQDKNSNVINDIMAYINSINKKTENGIKDVSELTMRHVRQYIHNQMAQELVSILQSNKEFRKAVLREAMTGEIKFGGVAPEAIANYVLTWSLDGTCDIEDIYEYADAHANNVSGLTEDDIEDFTNKMVPTINFKGSSGKSYSAMRIGIYSSKLMLDYGKIEEATLSDIDKEIEDAVKADNKELAADLQKTKENIKDVLKGLNGKLDNTPQNNKSKSRPRGRNSK